MQAPEDWTEESAKDDAPVTLDDEQIALANTPATREPEAPVESETDAWGQVKPVAKGRGRGRPGEAEEEGANVSSVYGVKK